MEWREVAKNRPATFIALACAAAVLGLRLFGDFRVAQAVADAIGRLAAYRLDDVLLAAAVVATGLLVDRRRAAVAEAIRENRLHVLKATMHAVQDIVNNFINETLLIEVEMDAALPRETAELLASKRRETINRLAALADMDSTPEIETDFGMAIDFGGDARLSKTAKLSK